ncbi:MAG: LemA family protein [Candidatus Woesearchaeota archaeon]|jgi:LemA protein
MKKWIIPTIIILGIALIIGLWYIGTYNSLVKLNEETNNKWAQVETQYQRRVDLIPNLVNTVKGASNFEASTLEEITRLRSAWQNAPTINDKIETANQIESSISKLLLITENYPELKATANYQALQDELANTENKIAVERGRYNEAVKLFNVKIKSFPSNIIAKNLGYEQRTYFESKQGADISPEVNFGK